MTPRATPERPSSLLRRMASLPVLDQAFRDVYAQRLAARADDDIWHLRRAWPEVRAALQRALWDGAYKPSLGKIEKGFDSAND